MKQIQTDKSKFDRVREYAEKVFDGLPEYREMHVVLRSRDGVIFPYNTLEENKPVLDQDEFLYKITRVNSVTTVILIF